MKKTSRTRKIQRPNNYRLCRLYNEIGEYIKQLDRLPDAAAVRKSRPRSAPAGLVDMVF